MARIFTEGFEMGDALGLGGNYTPTSFYKRTGVYGAQLFGTYGFLQLNSLSEVYIRVAFWVSGTPPANLDIRLPDASYNGIDLIKFYINIASNPLFTAYVNNSLVATGSKIITNGPWYLFEAHVKIDDSVGVIQTKINGILDIDYSGDTDPTSSAKMNYLYILGGTGGGASYSIDDVAVNDTNGAVDNSWCGDGHVILYKPNATGSATMLMGSDGNQTDNYLLVDDVPTDGDTTYVYSGSPGYYDLYKLENTDLPVNYRITRAWVEARAKDPETDYVSGVIQTASGSYTSASVQLTTDYSAIKFQEYTTNPSTGSAWTSDEVDYLQVGVMIEEE